MGIGSAMTEAQMKQHCALLGVFLDEARERKGLTRYEVAKQLGTTEGIVRGWEQATVLMDMEKLRAYCQAIELPLHEFLWSFENALMDAASPLWADIFR